MSSIALGVSGCTSLRYVAFGGRFLGDDVPHGVSGRSLGFGRSIAGDNPSVRTRFMAVYLGGADLGTAPTLSTA